MKSILDRIILAAVTGAVPPLLAQQPDIANDRIHVIYEAPSGIGPDLDVPPPPTPWSVMIENALPDATDFVELLSVTPEEVETVDQEWADRFRPISPPPDRIGIVRNPGNAAIDITAARETLLPDGRTLWTMAVRSPHACGLRVHMSDFDVGDGEALIFSPGAEGLVVHGPFTGLGPSGTGDFWTASLPGDTAFIEIAAAQPPRFRIEQLVHFDRPPGDGSGPRTRCNPPNPALECNLDVMCHNVDISARQATGQMNFVVGMGCGVCTGTLLNDLDGETAVPYFLTANHCVSTQAQIDSLEVAFFYQTNFCGDPATPNWNASTRIVGGTLLAGADAAGGNDMSFIRLSGLPSGAMLAGWTTATSAGAYGIHHPAGWWKRVYFISGVGACPGCETCPWDSDEFDFYDMDDGIMQGGSSGSGAFTGSGQLCGTLTGQCCIVVGCSDPDAECTNRDNFVVAYGEFEQTYPLIRRWLEIGGTINVNRNHNGPEDGTPTFPFNTFVEAYNLAWNDTRIRLVANNYPETGVFGKRVTLIGSGGSVTIGR